MRSHLSCMWRADRRASRDVAPSRLRQTRAVVSGSNKRKTPPPPPVRTRPELDAKGPEGLKPWPFESFCTFGDGEETHTRLRGVCDQDGDIQWRRRHSRRLRVGSFLLHCQADHFSHGLAHCGVPEAGLRRALLPLPRVRCTECLDSPNVSCAPMRQDTVRRECTRTLELGVVQSTFGANG